MLARLGDVKLEIEMLARPSGVSSVRVPLSGANSADIEPGHKFEFKHSESTFK